MIVCADTARFVFSLSVGSPFCVTIAAFPRCIGAVCLLLSSSANSADLKLQQLASHATLGSVSVVEVKEFFGSQSGLEALEHTQCSVPMRKPSTQTQDQRCQYRVLPLMFLVLICCSWARQDALLNRVGPWRRLPRPAFPSSTVATGVSRHS